MAKDNEIVKHIKDTVKKNVPADAEVTSIELEGPEIAIYTKNPRAFFEGDNVVSRLAFELKKRINIRTDESLLLDPAKAEKKIREIVPPEADIRDIAFLTPFSEVAIESIKPGLVIGKSGETSKRIILETGWVPNIVRAPSTPSKILTGLRKHLHKYASERKKVLRDTAKKIYEKEIGPNKWVRITALGGYREVGKSAMLVETQDTRVLIDCGTDPSGMKEESYPALEVLRYPLNEIDAIIISHAHTDHAAFLPYLFRMGYDGPVYCTPPTRDLMALLDFDGINVTVREGREPMYTEKDVKEMLKHCITREYREITDIAPDMRLTFHNAAHILGSASVHLNIGEGAHNLVYSADIKYGFTRLFNNIDLNYPRMETLILESTYGSKEQPPDRAESEDQLIRTIKETVQNGGNVLIPSFSVGRGQELMLVIEEYYRRGALEAKVYIDGMTKEASAIHTAYPEYLRKNVQRRVLQNDSPFTSELFQISDAKDRQKILDEGGAVIIASSGMLNGGASLDYFYKMAEDPKNTIIFSGYQAANSLGRKVQTGLKSMPIMENGKPRTLNIRMRVESNEGFSGHASRSELIGYMRALHPKPKRVLVNHGSATVDFAKFVSNKFKVNATAPRNLDAVRLR